MAVFALQHQDALGRQFKGRETRGIGREDYDGGRGLDDPFPGRGKKDEVGNFRGKKKSVAICNCQAKVIPQEAEQGLRESPGAVTGNHNRKNFTSLHSGDDPRFLSKNILCILT